jgi:hypothetical protein
VKHRDEWRNIIILKFIFSGKEFSLLFCNDEESFIGRGLLLLLLLFDAVLQQQKNIIKS